MPTAKAEDYGSKSLGLFLGDISSRDQSNLDEQSTSHRINEDTVSGHQSSQFKEVTINEIKMKTFLNQLTNPKIAENEEIPDDFFYFTEQDKNGKTSAQQAILV